MAREMWSSAPRGRRGRVVFVMPVPPPPASADHGYLDLRGASAWADLGLRGTVVATGDDAARFVDKFTTAAVAALDQAAGTEGFFCDAKGHVLAHAAILRTAEGLVIDCDSRVAGMLRDHLEHYHIRERLDLVDATADTAAFVFGGPQAAAWLAGRAAVPTRLGEHVQTSLGQIPVHLVASDMLGDGTVLARVAVAAAQPLRDWLVAQGLPQAASAAVEAVRIEERYPSAVDIPEKTLPQELDRTARAISFTKGCYLGQETVARLDALGHVNRTLSLVAIDAAAPPPPGTPVLLDRQEIGVLTSACLSPRWAAVGLGLVHRRGHAAVLSVAGAAARVVAPVPGFCMEPTP